jgi:hypothetical protein
MSEANSESQPTACKGGPECRSWVPCVGDCQFTELLEEWRKQFGDPTPPVSPDLKLCPFCGGEAGLVCNGPSIQQAERARAWGEDYDVSYYVQCCGCAAIGTEAAERDAAIAAWNRRRLEQAAPELLELVKAFVTAEVDYMTLNNLGDPEQQHNVKWARAVIAKVEGLSA